MARILVIEDERDLQKVLEFNLNQAGHEVLTSLGGRTGLQLARERHPDVVVLDLMLPDLAGTEVCRALKRDPQTSDIAVLMLTAKGEEVDRIVGFELGADDYVPKPFSPRELAARIKAILRRAEPSSQDAVLTAGEIVLRRDAHDVTVEGASVQLTAKEFDLLTCFLEHQGIVLSRERLLDIVWGMSYPGGTRTVDMHVAQLRRKLGSVDAIRTVRGAGYKLLVT
jgi:two-component system, OmpR family, phosphate regulon response regulator PhoB